MTRCCFLAFFVAVTPIDTSARGSGDLVNMHIAPDGMRLSSDYLLFTADEAQQSADLNADGDQADSVLQVFDLGAKTILNTGLAVTAGTELDSNLAVQESGWAALTVREADQGAVDLNGDGDALDRVVHLFHPATQTLRNLELDASSLLFDGETLVFTVDESLQGNHTLNGDADAGDNVLHVYDVATERVTNLGFACGSFAESGFQMNAGRIALEVPEFQQSQDLTGDGDQNDFVPVVFELPDLVPILFGLNSAGEFRLEPDYLLVSVGEINAGMDLNGNGTLTDKVAHLVELGSGSVRNLGTDIVFVSASEANVAYGVLEAHLALDLNADGDMLDEVVQLWSPAAGVWNTGLAGVPGDLTDSVLVVRVDEAQQGALDLNGDGVASGAVAHAVSLRALEVTNTGSTSIQAWADGSWMIYAVPESVHGDLNGDGDTNDSVARLLHVPSHVSVELGLATVPGMSHPLALEDGLGAVLVPEAAQGSADLDGDGLVDGTVPHVFEIGAAPVNLAVQTGQLDELEIDAQRVFLRVIETTADLNGDGDTLDAVLHEYER